VKPHLLRELSLDRTESRKSDIKSRLASLIDLKSLPADLREKNDRRRSFGHAMIALGVLILVAGLYLPVGDGISRAIFLFGALLYAGLGAKAIDQANRR
jgi:hypothetical protein